MSTFACVYAAKFNKNWPYCCGDIMIFRFSRWILKISKLFVVYWIGMTNTHHNIKFHQNRSNSCRNIAFNYFQIGGRASLYLNLNS